MAQDLHDHSRGDDSTICGTPRATLLLVQGVNTYSHVLPALQREAAARLDQLLTGHGNHSKNAMTWGTVELEPEVTRWLEGLSDEDFGRAAFYVDLLEREGVHLGEPYARQLRGKFRKLRFRLGRRIILLTVFRKTKEREEAEIDRAEAAMSRCIAEVHTAEKDS